MNYPFSQVLKCLPLLWVYCIVAPRERETLPLGHKAILRYIFQTSVVCYAGVIKESTASYTNTNSTQRRPSPPLSYILNLEDRPKHFHLCFIMAMTLGIWSTIEYFLVLVSSESMLLMLFVWKNT